MRQYRVRLSVSILVYKENALFTSDINWGQNDSN
jgi:hypothetical protein